MQITDKTLENIKAVYNKPNNNHQIIQALASELIRMRAAVRESISDVKGAQFIDNDWRQGRMEQNALVLSLKIALDGVPDEKG